MSEYVVETKQLTKTYGLITALNKVDVKVKRGSIYGLIGDNGAGKSTLLKLLAGQSFKTSGEFSLFGTNTEKGLEQARKSIGFLIETPYLKNLTATQTLTYYAIQKGVPDAKVVGDLMQLTGISSCHKVKSENLSLGQKQRLGLAIAMLCEPQLLILDEPINGLDPSGILEFRNLILRLNREKNITFLISSHILPELEQIATDYGFLSHGELVEEISAKELQQKCTDSIELKVSDVGRYCVLLEKKEIKEVFSVLSDDTITIATPKENAKTYSKLATDHGIYILGMQYKKASLEDYYMEIKKRRAIQ